MKRLPLPLALCFLALLVACNFPALTTSGAKTTAQPSPTSPPTATVQPTAVSVPVNPTLPVPEQVIPTPTAQAQPGIAPGVPTVVAQPVVSAPAISIPTSGAYTLMPGEFPWCIARRYNLHPRELLWANGLSSDQIYYPGLVLQLPATGHPYPGVRALRPHPASYVIRWNGQTLRYVACYFGDVDPTALAAAYNVTPDTPLPLGMAINVP